MHSVRTCPRLFVQSTGPRPAKRRCLSSEGTRPHKILFFGADRFSCVTLETLYAARQDLIQHLVVVTPPDQKTGRRLKDVHRPPLRILAESLSIPSIALPPPLLKEWIPPPEFLIPSQSRCEPSSLLLTASYGHLLPTALLSRFEPLNTLNLHPSMLPSYRGAAPIQWGIINGDADANWNSTHLDSPRGMGVSVQELSHGKFDRGRILAQEKIARAAGLFRLLCLAMVPPRSDFSTLEPFLARAGSELVVKVLRDLPRYQANARPQDPSRATSAPKLTKASARINWNTTSATEITRLQRGIGHQVSRKTPCLPLFAAFHRTTRALPNNNASIPPLEAAAATTQLQLVLGDSGPLRLLSGLSPRPDRPGLMFGFDKSVFVTAARNSLDGTDRWADSAETPFDSQDKIEVIQVSKVKKEGGKWTEARDWWNGVKRHVTNGWLELE
ncbi:hypothetical protein JCM3766R1_001275 [Sporobolomyces carnicolor]